MYNSTSEGFSILDKCWYTLEFKPFSGTKSDAIEVFRKLFYDSVELHLVSDVNVGFALSGGLDSSSVLFTAAKICSESSSKINTFSAVNSNKLFSEHDWISIATFNLENLNSYFVSPDVDDMLNNIDSMIFTMDEPYQSQSAFFGNCVYRSVSKTNVKVLLNGQGADEYLGLYGHHRFLS